MSHVSLSRLEAEERADQLTVESMIIELDLTDPAAETFGSRTVITFRSRTDESFVEFRGRNLVAARLNHDDLDPDCWQGGRIRLSGLRAENTLVIEGRMRYADDGEGLHRHIDPQDQQTYLYAMSFLDAAPRWFACFDQPDLKARYEVRVAAPEHWLVIGNGPGEMVGPGRWVINPAGRLASYFVTVVAGPYVSVVDEHAGIRLGFHARASLAAELQTEAADMIEVTRQSFDYYHRLFDIPYPFGEYHQAFVPDFNAGAMENPGCVTLRDGFLYRGRATEADRGRRANVIAHEMAHMWFGDLVTMRWWDNLWLNESFAEYLAHRCCTVATAYPLWTEFGILRKDWGLVADQSPSTHPIAGQDAADTQIALQNFDGIAYAKGAAVLKQLASHLGDGVFVAGLRSYIDRFAYRNATFEDLIDTWTSAGAVDLGSWAEAWLRTAGPDTIDLIWTRPDQAMITRAGPAGGAAGRVHALAVGSVDSAGAVTALGAHSLADDPVVVTVPEHAALVVPDATDATWAKIRFGPDGWSRLAPVLPMINDEPVLVVIYNAIRDAVRSADLDPPTALDLIITGMPTVRAELIVSSVLTFATDQLAGSYCPVPERPARLARVRDLAGRLLAAAEPGSDRQLTAFRLLVRGHDDAERLRGWEGGRDLPEGLTLDPDLHWELVRRLAVVAPDPRSIDAALDRDRSSAGRVQAARARAALGTAEAKAAAWARLMRPSELTAYELYATGEGFFDPAQTDLTGSYVARFFTEIGATAEFRSGWSLGEVATKAYPWSATTPQTLELAGRALATELAAPIRRALVDATDQLRRAVIALRRYPGPEA